MSTTYSHPPKYIRSFDVQRDLLPVANLVEMCFADRLSREGKALVNKMRSSAKSKRFKRWAARAAGRASMPLSGFVWEDGERIVGNLSFIPYRSFLHHHYLIANVAVHPDYQRQGIGKSLVQTALRDLNGRNLDGIWLQVEEDNQAALDLYTKIGFREHTRRTTWRLDPKRWKKLFVETHQKGMQVKSRPIGHWQQQRRWLRKVYPPTIRWYLSLKPGFLRGGLWGMLASFFLEGPWIKQWSAVDVAGNLLGVLSWQATTTFDDRLWLAAPPSDRALAVEAFFPFLTQTERFPRSLRLNYPAGQAVSALKKGGFNPIRTLVWMEWK